MKENWSSFSLDAPINCMIKLQREDNKILKLGLYLQEIIDYIQKDCKNLAFN